MSSTNRVFGNCFPCMGPGCNSCGKFDAINEKTREQSNAFVCKVCGGRIDPGSGMCPECGHQAYAAPGTSVKDPTCSESS